MFSSVRSSGDMHDVTLNFHGSLSQSCACSKESQFYPLQFDLADHIGTSPLARGLGLCGLNFHLNCPQTFRPCQSLWLYQDCLHHSLQTKHKAESSTWRILSPLSPWIASMTSYFATYSFLPSLDIHSWSATNHAGFTCSARKSYWEVDLVKILLAL